jgi:hypothetical protein
VLAAGQRPHAALDQVVAGFVVDRATAPQVLEYLFNRDHLIVGMEVIGRPARVASAVQLGERQISGAFGPGPIREILEQLVAADPDFIWMEDQGVVNLVGRANHADPGYPFDRTVEAFDAVDLPYAEALSNALLMEYHTLGGWPWGFGLRHGLREGPRVTMHLRQVPLRKVFNEIARQTGLAWRVNYRPGDQMMGLLITSGFDLESGACGECSAPSITPVPPPVQPPPPAPSP